MTGIAISVFVKNPNATRYGNIHFHDIGDNIPEKEKLSIIKNFRSLKGITDSAKWQVIIPDEHHDWLNQRDSSFEAFIRIGDKKTKSKDVLFETYTLGINSNRDAWCYNASEQKLLESMEAMIATYNEEVVKFSLMPQGTKATDVINTDPRQISWSSSLIPPLERGKSGEFRQEAATVAAYRPFQKTWLYYDRMFNHRTGQLPRIFPTGAEENLVICVSGLGARAGFAALMTDKIPNLHTIDSGQCFPLKLFGVNVETDDEDLFATDTEELAYSVRDGITDVGLKHFQDAYPGETITKEDLFYYVYGLLHSEDYRAKYADNLSKELPRIPRVKTAADFWAFSRAGRELGDLHVNYETVDPYPVTIKQGDLRLADIKNPEAFYRVTKWAFGKNGKEKDKTTVIYNANITMTDVPLEAYDYVVNGKPALEWVMERQVVKVDKDSGIENDANRYAIETMNNPAYPLELFQRVITVSLRTMEIVRALPKLEVM
ncbi:MAG: hypothetical protein JJU24_19070 [Natronohydrobacter sp.]|nr:hypothetical protein [Natronohydrobacter sp.]